MLWLVQGLVQGLQGLVGDGRDHHAHVERLEVEVVRLVGGVHGESYEVQDQVRLVVGRLDGETYDSRLVGGHAHGQMYDVLVALSFRYFYSL